MSYNNLPPVPPPAKASTRYSSNYPFNQPAYAGMFAPPAAPVASPKAPAPVASPQSPAPVASPQAPAQSAQARARNQTPDSQLAHYERRVRDLEAQVKALEEANQMLVARISAQPAGDPTKASALTMPPEWLKYKADQERYRIMKSDPDYSGFLEQQRAEQRRRNEMLARHAQRHLGMQFGPPAWSASPQGGALGGLVGKK